MPKQAILWAAKCLLFLCAGWLLLGILQRTATPAILWILMHRGIVHPPRHADVFAILAAPLRFGLYLNPFYGVVLGLIPIHRLRELVRSASGRFAAPSETASGTEDELNPRRPILWTWAPLFFVDLCLFLAWRSPATSVLATGGPSRFEYFFSEPGYVQLGVNDFEHWMIVRSLVNLTLFYLAYPLGVWLRHQWPAPPAVMEGTAEDAG